MPAMLAQFSGRPFAGIVRKTAHKRRPKMRTIKVALLVCVAVAAILLSGQSVWAEKTEVEWYECGGIQTQFLGTTWLIGTPPYNIEVVYVRGCFYYVPLYMYGECPADQTVNPPDGYLVIEYDGDYTMDAEGWAGLVGPESGRFWIITGSASPYIQPNGRFTLPSLPVWQGTWTGATTLDTRWKALDGEGLGENAGLKLQLFMEPVDPANPGTGDKVLRGRITGPRRR
jgi:hypothetical protein